METTDLSEIIEDLLRSPEYSMKYLDAHPPFFIWQFTSGSGHHGAIAVESGDSPYLSGTAVRKNTESIRFTPKQEN